jgi:transposase-like protein
VRRAGEKLFIDYSGDTAAVIDLERPVTFNRNQRSGSSGILTNAIESLNAKLRRSVRIRGHFPTGEAAMKLIWIQLREITKNWKMPPREWSAAKVQFAVVFGDRFEVR